MSQWLFYQVALCCILVAHMTESFRVSRVPTRTPRVAGICRGTRPATTTRSSDCTSRSRDDLLFSLGSLVIGVGGLVGRPLHSHAVSDEYEVEFDPTAGSIGLSLDDFGSQGKYRCYVRRVVPGSQASTKPMLRAPALLVKIGSDNVEGLPARMVKDLLVKRRTEGEKFTVTFRNPARFEELLTQRGDQAAQVGEEVSTQLAPETRSREAQILRVKRTAIPDVCEYGAQYGDLLEIAYKTSLEDGTELDSSRRGGAGRAGDTTLYFVLGQQPPGQFPKGWDLSLVGSCVGEERRVVVPPVLVGPKGNRKLNIPPNSSLIYDVKIIGINANNQPR